MPTENQPIVPVRLVLGMVTFILGALFLADSADLLRADSALAFWPVAIIALALVVVLQPDTGNRMVGAVLLIAGVWLLLNAVDVWTYRFWQTWPYLFVLFGAWMIYRTYQMREREDQDGWVTGFAFLNRIDTRGTSTPIASGDVSAVAGECAIDLRDVQAGDGPMIIDVFALFGRIVLQVPAGWRVDTRVLPLLGRVNGVPESAADGPTLIVQGSAIGSSVSVTQG